MQTCWVNASKGVNTTGAASARALSSWNANCVTRTQAAPSALADWWVSLTPQSNHLPGIQADCLHTASSLLLSPTSAYRCLLDGHEVVPEALGV